MLKKLLSGVLSVLLVISCMASVLTVLASAATVAVSTTGNGAAKVVESTTTAGEYTFTATPYQTSSFLGWYNGETLVSSDTVYVTTLAEDTTLTAKFSDINLLEGKNIPNPTLASETENTTGANITSSVTETEGWWSNGWARGKYVASEESRYGGASIYNPRQKKCGHVYTMLLKPNTTYSIQFSFKSSEQIFGLRILDNTATFYYGTANDGKSADGILKGVTGVIHSFINSSYTDCKDWADYTTTFTTNDSTEETIPYYIYFDAYNKDATTTEYAGSYISDLSLIDLAEHPITATSTGNGAAKPSKDTAKKGEVVTFTATAYQDSQFLGWYNGESLVSTDAEYSVTVAGDTALTAKFSDTNLIEDKINTDWYKWNNTHGHITNNTLTTGNSYLGGNSVNVQNPSYQFHYFMADLEANTKYKFQTYINGYEGSSIKVESIRVFKLADAEGYSGDSDKYKPLDTVNSYYKTYSEAKILSSWTAYPSAPLEFITDTAETYVIGVKFGACSVTSGTCYANISDWSLIKGSSVHYFSVDYEGNGAAKVSAETVESGKTVTFTATPYQISTFEGWYNGETLVSTDNPYTITANGDLSLTAKFTETNLAKDITKENFGDMSPNNVYFEDADDSRYGGNTTKIRAIQYQTAYVDLSGITFKADTTYTVSFSIYTPMIPLGSYAILDSNGARWDSVYGNSDGSTNDGGQCLNLSEVALSTVKSANMNNVDNAGKWHDFTTEFTVGETDCTSAYLYMSFPAHFTGAVYDGNLNYIYLSDLSIIDPSENVVDVKVRKEGNGTVKSTVVDLAEGKDVTLVATPYQDSKFIGWYDADGNELSASTQYKATITEDLEITAKFTDTNLLANLTLKDWFHKENNYKSTDTTESLYSDNAVVIRDPNYQGIYVKVNLKANTTYRFQGYVKGNAKLENIRVFPSSKLDKSFPNGSVVPVGQPTATLVSAMTTTAGAGFVAYPETAFEFTTAEADEYIIAIKFGGVEPTTNPEQWPDYDPDTMTLTEYRSVILSDFSLMDLDQRYNVDFTEFLGNSIRVEGTQALRYTYSIDENLLANGYQGYQVKEIGIAAMRTKYLNGADLKLNTTYVYGEISRTCKVGVVYDSDFNGFAYTEGGRSYFNIALTNIGVNSVSHAVTFADYGDDYTVRPYMILTDGVAELTVYDDMNEASVFAVMNTILTAYKNTATPSHQLAGDYANVMAILNSTETDSKGMTAMEAYIAKYPEE